MEENTTENPGTDGKTKKGPAITVVRSTEAAPPDVTTPLEPSAEAPKRRGRPPGTGTGPKKARKAAAAPTMETGATEFRVRAVLKFLSVDPNGTRTYFDRAVSATGPTAAEAEKTLASRLSKIHDAWRKVYLR
jgi:hypothetical protein